MKIAYLAHPLSGDVPGNLARARRWLAWAWREHPDMGFVADWILCCEVMDDAVPGNRERGLLFDEELVARCDELWLVGGRVSGGMQRERDAAIAAGLTVRDLTKLGPEPPGAEQCAGGTKNGRCRRPANHKGVCCGCPGKHDGGFNPPRVPA